MWIDSAFLNRRALGNKQVVFLVRPEMRLKIDGSEVDYLLGCSADLVSHGNLGEKAHL